MNLIGKRVHVYRNLRHGHKAPKLYSIMYRGKVVDRREHVLLANVKFVVRPGGRKRALETGRKNVHAFAVGTLCGGCDSYGSFPVRLIYDPRHDDKFCDLGTGGPVTGADTVALNQSGISAYNVF